MAATMAVTTMASPSAVALRSSVAAPGSTASFAPLRLGESASYGFSSCALRCSGVQELSKPSYALGLSSRGGGKRDFLLTGAVAQLGMMVFVVSIAF